MFYHKSLISNFKCSLFTTVFNLQKKICISLDSKPELSTGERSIPTCYNDCESTRCLVTSTILKHIGDFVDRTGLIEAVVGGWSSNLRDCPRIICGSRGIPEDKDEIIVAGIDTKTCRAVGNDGIYVVTSSYSGFKEKDLLMNLPD